MPAELCGGHAVQRGELLAEHRLGPRRGPAEVDPLQRQERTTRGCAQPQHAWHTHRRRALQLVQPLSLGFEHLEPIGIRQLYEQRSVAGQPLHALVDAAAADRMPRPVGNVSPRRVRECRSEIVRRQLSIP